MIEIFQIPFMQQALLASLLAGVTCAFLAVFVVLKRVVFVGIALAQLSSAGVALALLLGLTAGWHLTLSSLVFMLAGVALFSAPLGGRQLPREAIIGIAYAVASALGILLVARSAAGESHMLYLLFGNILAVTPLDNWLMGGVFAAVALIHYLFHKEFVLVSFDPETADTLGVRSRRWELLFYLTLGVTIAIALRVLGALLVFSFLVIPGVIGLLVAPRLRGAFVGAALAAVVSAAAGLYLSFALDLPTAATIVLLAFALLCFSGLWARFVARRGD